MHGKKQDTLPLKIRKFFEFRAEFFCPVLLGFFVLFSLCPLLLPGLPGGEAAGFHVSRVSALAAEISNGNFPVLVNTGAFNGFGHGAGLFAPDILLLPAAILVVLSVPLLEACKIFMVLTAFFAAYSTYYAVWKICRDPHAAYAGGMLYALCSYFACNYFVRAAYDEWLAMAFLPWIVLGMWQVVYARKPSWGALTTGMAGVLAAHPVTAFMAFVFCLVIFAGNSVRMFRRPRRIFVAVAALLLAVGMNIYWIAPALEEILSAPYNFYFLGKTAEAPFNHCVPLTRLILETPYIQPGKWIPAGIGIIFAILLLRRWRFGSPGQKIDKYRDLVFLAGGGALLAATDFLPWEWQIPGVGMIEYPWRAYAIASCALASGGALLLAGIFAWNSRKRKFWLILTTLGAFSGWWFTAGAAYLADNLYYGEGSGADHPENCAYLPEFWSGIDYFSNRGVEAEIITGEGEVKAERVSDRKFLLHYDKTPGFPLIVELPAVYFRGWYSKLKGLPSRPVPAELAESDLLTVRIPAVEESGTMEVCYEGTSVQKVSAGTSLCLFTFAIGALLLNIFKINPFRTNKNKHKI